jgi:hypothetical protein
MPRRNGSYSNTSVLQASQTEHSNMAQSMQAESRCGTSQYSSTERRSKDSGNTGNQLKSGKSSSISSSSSNNNNCRSSNSSSSSRSNKDNYRGGIEPDSEVNKHMHMHIRTHSHTLTHSVLDPPPPAHNSQVRPRQPKTNRLFYFALLPAAFAASAASINASARAPNRWTRHHRQAVREQ